MLLLSGLGLLALEYCRLHIGVDREIVALVQKALVLLLPHAFVLVGNLGVSVQGQRVLLSLEQALLSWVEL